MLSEKLTKALNEQVKEEYYSAYLYLSMAAFAERAAFKGIANWLFVQAKEEMAHGIHMYRYILERDGTPVFAAIQQPPGSFTGIDGIFEEVLAHEQKITESINNIASLAMQENDHACYQFMMWYVNEQVEEEASAKDIIAKLKILGNDKGLLFALDHELAKKEFDNPFPADSKISG